MKSVYNLNYGDKVKIVSNESGHDFEIGQIVFFDQYEIDDSAILYDDSAILYDDLDDGNYGFVVFCDFEVL